MHCNPKCIFRFFFMLQNKVGKHFVYRFREAQLKMLSCAKMEHWVVWLRAGTDQALNDKLMEVYARNNNVLVPYSHVILQWSLKVLQLSEFFN